MSLFPCFFYSSLFLTYSFLLSCPLSCSSPSPLYLYLHTVSCERGQFSSETDRSRVMNGVGFSETVPVCEVCPLDSYSDSLGSPVCSQCPKYHTTSFTGATSVDDCLREHIFSIQNQFHSYTLHIVEHLSILSKIHCFSMKQQLHLYRFFSLHCKVFFSLVRVSPAQPLVLECEAMTTSDHIDIDCRTNRPPQTIYCSFSGGPKQLCTFHSTLS